MDGSQEPHLGSQVDAHLRRGGQGFVFRLDAPDQRLRGLRYRLGQERQLALDLRLREAKL
ncbi:MAG: hypothetical protein V4609_15600 [Pseudomonadota bacterium]